METSWSFDDSICYFCSEKFDLESFIAQMRDINCNDSKVICHLHCGLENNLWVERMVYPYVGSDYC